MVKFWKLRSLVRLRERVREVSRMTKFLMSYWVRDAGYISLPVGL